MKFLSLRTVMTLLIGNKVHHFSFRNFYSVDILDDIKTRSTFLSWIEDDRIVVLSFSLISDKHARPYIGKINYA